MEPLVERSDRGSAVFSADRQHRFWLKRHIGTGAGNCCFILLNPSTADAGTDDPTISTCIRRAKQMKLDAITVVNLFSLMTSDPRVLVNSPLKNLPENDQYVLNATSEADIVIAAWGRYGNLEGRSNQVRSMLNDAGIDLLMFGITKNGEPRHPLYIPASSPLQLFE